MTSENVQLNPCEELQTVALILVILQQQKKKEGNVLSPHLQHYYKVSCHPLGLISVQSSVKECTYLHIKCTVTEL